MPPRVRDAEASRRRILTAATAEFAAHGIAGARMDRVAAEAASAKERIYAYYGNKDALFDAVFTETIRQILDTVHFDATDLPGYAGRMFDYFTDHPDAQRLTTWYRLERPAGHALAAVVEANRTRLDALATAALTTDFSPVELLTLVQAMASAWGTMNPEFAEAAATSDRQSRRRAVVEAVGRLVT
ncbi:AcrR family transcriptional regulator [Actinoplanes tereljensis]|uniref:TetR family regulatory protein n=1 Tax=Paractinoplanes tereljensis TaxID=571912 RepID=A0A919NHG7_9ACTN|nr:TetR family transcriptional regulator [Actinoplanes tereljensis]GIF18071.1 putative TetR family regulatory protein [Actinoplanes tereljensis]